MKKKSKVDIKKNEKFNFNNLNKASGLRMNTTFSRDMIYEDDWKRIMGIKDGK